ncbi:unnamed protein product [Enterobius vermicularis]|uniref:RING-type E3 ubiquitin transferase n=1 Tax=Enterobius vermicularis TaxID=51028 RepID=A0A0N4UTH4_ENTVE|nr:unnamed protein product [Enterobius vermicularis]
MVIEGTSSIPSQSLSSNNIEAASTKESPESTKTSEGGTDTSGPSQSKSAKQDDENSRFECNICLEQAKDAVISMCGHLFCWPCLHQWLDTRPHLQLCPVCKSAISRDKVIPLYGRGGSGEDPRNKTVPPRPKGQRTEAPQNSHHGFFPGFQWGAENNGAVQFSMGIGIFPISFFASFFNPGFVERRPDPPLAGTPQAEDERLLSNAFLILASVFIFWLLLL